MSSSEKKIDTLLSNPEEEELLKYQNVEYFEDFLQLIGPNGWRNILVFVMASLAGLTNPLVSFTYSFLGATPDYWCHVPELSSVNWTIEEIKTLSIPMELRDGEWNFAKCSMYDRNYEELARLPFQEAFRLVNQTASSDPIECRQRVFDDIPESVVTKWDLVCDRRAIYSITQSAVHCGSLVGCLIVGYLMDKYGRILVYRVAVGFHIAVGFLLAASPNIGVFIGLRVISAMSAMSFYMAAFVIAVEFTTCSQRSVVATYFVIPWAFGIMLAAVIGFCVHTWYWLQIALTVPNVILLFAMYYLPESPRWLITQGKFKKAHKILNYFAKGNGKRFSYTPALEDAMNIIKESSTNETTDSEKSVIRKFLEVLKENSMLLRIHQLRKKTLVLFFSWMSASMIYYSISLGSSAIKTSDHVFIFAGGVIELMAYICLWPAAAFLGRRCSLVLTYWMCSVTLLGVMILVIVVAKSDMVILKLILFLVGKFAITANFHLLWVYTAELYPTTYRSMAMAQNSTIARIGSIASPFFNDILGEVASWAPSAVFGAISLMAGITGLSLPETNNKVLSDGLEPAKKRRNTPSEKL